jgi:hypothetical protein
MAARVLVYHNFIINIACMVARRLINVEENKSWERLNVHAVPLVRYMGNGTEGLQNVWDSIHAGDEGVAFPIQVRWLVNPHEVKKRGQMGEISASSLVNKVRVSNTAQSMVKESLQAAGVWY